MSTCPVCGYDKLEFPPINFSICACCGTEFGYDDRVLSHEQLRNVWIDRECPWFDVLEPKPAGWNPYLQMLRANLRLDIPKLIVGIRVQANATIAIRQEEDVRPNMILLPVRNFSYA